MVLDFSEATVRNLAFWTERWHAAATEPIEELPPPKVFTPKFALPILADYTKTAPPSYWANFPANYSWPATSLINPDLLRSLALESGFQDVPTLEKVYIDLKYGADIGCRGEFRRPGRASNAPSAFEQGPKVSDAIADWCKKGFAMGPIDDKDVPSDAKFAGIMTRSKPNGSARIILNLSAPLGRAVNEGIDNENFPTSMSSTSKWLEALHAAGRNCDMVKVDWSDAYKHVGVRPADINLQWFRWLGKNFAELCLIFGCKSSAGIFDRLAKVVLHIVRVRSGLPAVQVIQHLDDCCAAAADGDLRLHAFDAEFACVADKLGIKLAPRSDPDKSFGPSKQGVILGVFYDTAKWTWSMPHEKRCRLLHALRDTQVADFLTVEQCQSLVGKILHIKALVPGGKFNLYHLLRAQNYSSDPKACVPLSSDIKRQFFFWFTMLRTCAEEAAIPDPSVFLPPWALQVYTDAAGGSYAHVGRGAGAVTPGWWVYVPWSDAINQGRPTGDGRRLDRVMSALELLGPLAALCAGADFCRGLPVTFHVDNSGSVFIFRKGYSTSCALSTTLVTALADVAAGLGCRINILKVRRCSSPLATTADALSKADFQRFWGLAAEQGGLGLSRTPLPVPTALLAWLRQPRPDFDLGQRLLRELALSGPVLGF